MQIFTSLFGRRIDPTASWPVIDFHLPVIDLKKMTFGNLQFAADLQDAACFGRPGRLSWTSKHDCELLYARQGFQLEFAAGQLCYLAFFIAADALLPAHPAMRYSQPELSDTIKLTHATTAADLTRMLGPVDFEDADTEETILLYSRQKVQLEFEMNERGFLKRFNMFPAG